MKVIQINSVSHSFSMSNYKKDFFKNWYARVAFQLKKFNQDLEVECWTPERFFKEEKSEIVKDVKFRIFPTNFSLRHGMEVCGKMVKALEKEVDDANVNNYRLIIHIHEYHSWIIYFILKNIRKSDNVKLIAQHHGGRGPFKNLIRYKKLFLFFPVIGIMQIFENLFLNKVDCFYVLSDEEEDYVRKRVLNPKIKFQTMGIEDEYFEVVEKNIARRELGLDDNKKYVLYLGRLSKTKGIKELLDAFKIIGSSVELLLMGEGVGFEEFKNYAAENNIENARFLGLIYGKEKLVYLSAVDCLILPSHTEGAPVVLMEAIAKNLPVISTNVGGISKMIENKKEGIIIRINSKKDIINSINQILNWENKDIKKYAEKYRWSEIIKNTYEDYIE